MFKGHVDDMKTLGVTECLRVKEQALLYQSEIFNLTTAMQA
jgi:hypothetical protein